MSLKIIFAVVLFVSTCVSAYASNNGTESQPFANSTPVDAMCGECPAGTYNPKPSSEPEQIACMKCDDNYFSRGGAVKCVACDQFSISNYPDECKPTPCPSGTYIGRDAARQRKCLSCDAGKYGTAENLAACSSCPAGTHSAVGASACLACAAGKYNLLTGAEICMDCDEGKTSGAGEAKCCCGAETAICLACQGNETV